MPNTNDELTEKKRKLQELIRARSKANCSSVVSSEIDVRRETEIEELEEEIQELEKKIKA
jgi:polyhydroxyalkanoate synthesis regulator phasin